MNNKSDICNLDVNNDRNELIRKGYPDKNNSAAEYSDDNLNIVIPDNAELIKFIPIDAPIKHPDEGKGKDRNELIRKGYPDKNNSAAEHSDDNLNIVIPDNAELIKFIPIDAPTKHPDEGKDDTVNSTAKSKPRKRIVYNLPLPEITGPVTVTIGDPEISESKAVDLDEKSPESQRQGDTHTCLKDDLEDEFLEAYYEAIDSCSKHNQPIPTKVNYKDSCDDEDDFADHSPACLRDALRSFEVNPQTASLLLEDHNEKKKKKPKKKKSNVDTADKSKSEMDAGSSCGTKPSPREILKRLMKHFHFKNLHGSLSKKGILYVYQAPIYVPVAKCGLGELIEEILNPAELEEVTIYDYNCVYDLLMIRPEIKIDDVSVSRKIVVFDNGPANIINRELLPCSPKKFYTHKINANYLPGQKHYTPVFDQFLEDCSGGDEEIKSLILAFIGYCLTNDRGGKCFFILGIKKDSGKSILGNLLQRLVGADAVSSVLLQDLGGNFSLDPLTDKLLNLAMDLPKTPLSDKAVGILKMLTGDDWLNVNKKYCDMYQAKIRACLVFSVNAPIILKNPDDAFWSRARIIPMQFSVDEERRDPKLLKKLWNERDGIVNKAIEAVREVILNNYKFPYSRIAQEMLRTWAHTDDYKIIKFVEECCELDPAAKTHTRSLYDRYLEFCDKERIFPAKEKGFSLSLKENFDLQSERWKTKSTKNAQWGFIGIRLIKEDPGIIYIC